MLDHMDGAELDTDQKKRGLEEFVELDCAISKNKELLNINNYNENFFIDQQQQLQNQNEITFFFASRKNGDNFCFVSGLV